MCNEKVGPLVFNVITEAMRLTRKQRAGPKNIASGSLKIGPWRRKRSPTWTPCLFPGNLETMEQVFLNPCAVGGACALRDRQSKRVVGSALSDRAMELASPACLFSSSPGGL